MHNWQSLQRKLIAAARANPPGDHVPYAFEKRVMALLAARTTTDRLALWVRGFWQAAASCVAVALLLGAWAFFNPAAPANANNLSQNLENTLLASVDQGDQIQ
ncbi:MAG: hypothetical protein ACLQAH_10670 [Limisphaerales bacterium]